MSGSWFYENFNAVPDDFFDDALKYIDFPLEDVESNDLEEDWEAKFQQLVPPPSNVLAGLTAGFCDENSNDIVEVKKSSSSVLDESSQPKQWPSAAEASSSRSIPVNYDPLETSSPVSVLESSSSSSSSAENATGHQSKFATPVKRPRSKRQRLQRRTFLFISTSYAPKQYHPLGSSESESESESCPDEKMLNLAQKKQKKKKLMRLSCTVEMKKPLSQQEVEIRKCTHCEVTKTPQWREGPMGPKTLCNACGVRYRSGRLFPEYRPAASPTFVPSIHSNSHRKVIEMRKKMKPMTTMAAMEASLPTLPECSF